MRSLRTSSDKDSDKSIIELLRQAMQTSIIEQSDKFTSGLSIGTAASPSVNYSTTYKANSPVNTIAIPPVNTTATIITPRADLNKPVQASSYTTAPHNEPAFTAWLRPVFAEANMKKLYDEKILNLHYGERVVYHNKLAAAQKTRDMLRGEKPDEMPECIKIRIMILNTETTEEDSIYIKKYALALPMIRIIQARLQFAKYDVAKVKFIELLYNHIQLFDVALSIKNSISIIDNAMQLLSVVYCMISGFDLLSTPIVKVDTDNQIADQWDVFSETPFIKLIYSAFSEFCKQQAPLYHLLVMSQLLNEFANVNFINTASCLNDLHDARMTDQPVNYKNMLKLNY